MKKFIIFTSLIFLLMSCSNIDENAEYVNNLEENNNLVLENTKIKERKIFLEEINKSYEEYRNLEFNTDNCTENMFLWNNIKHNFKLCLPYNWV